jgi:exopolyphosphatase/guanosine-5'-triphosphate,3'-diphosphate pyrophosphatase
LLELYTGSVVESKKKESIAIIDLGYNSVKISAYDIYKNGHYKKNFQRQEYVQIGLDLSKNNGLISKQNIERTASALLSFRKGLKEQDVDYVIPIATSAVRDAINQKEVIYDLKDQSGLYFNVLTGPEEGFFSYLGAQSYMHIPNGLFFDLGGGSMEVMHIQDYKIVKTVCAELGVLRLSEKFIEFDQYKNSDKFISRLDYGKLEKTISKNMPLRTQFKLDKSHELKLVAIGGTARSIYKFISKVFVLNLPFSHHHVFLEKRMIDLTNSIFSALSLHEMSNLRFVDPQRSKTITAGSFVLKILMEKLNFDTMFICPTGIREGVLEHYLYFRMDKKYRKRKKFIEINCEPIIVINNNANKKYPKHSSSSSSPATASANSNSYAFPRRLESFKVNKLLAE